MAKTGKSQMAIGSLDDFSAKRKQPVTLLPAQTEMNPNLEPII